jgi:hypothetical protein
MIIDQINVHIARELGGLDREHRVHVKKLSAGKRILMPGDDAGGYSLAIKVWRRVKTQPSNAGQFAKTGAERIRHSLTYGWRGLYISIAHQCLVIIHDKQ